MNTERMAMFTALIAVLALGTSCRANALSMDFHTHSYCSDGLKTPEAMVEQAQKGGLDYYALTDHDTVACLSRAQKKAQELGVRLIPGLEVSAEDDSIHILALGINPAAPGLLQFLQGSSVARLERARKIVDKLSAAGVTLDLKADILIPKLNRERSADGLTPADPSLLEGPVEAILAQLHGQITRPDIARALITKGYARDNAEAFAKYLGNGAPGDVPINGQPFSAVIETIHRANGIAVWAHPFLTFKDKKPQYSGKDYPDFETLAADMLAAGLDGFETYRDGWERFPQNYNRIRKVADDYLKKTGRKLLLTPGSDYHGYDQGGIGPRDMGGINLSAEAQQDLAPTAAHLAGGQ